MGGISGDDPGPVLLHIRALSELLAPRAYRAAWVGCGCDCEGNWLKTWGTVCFLGSVLRGTFGHWWARMPDGFSVNTREADEWVLGARAAGGRLRQRVVGAAGDTSPRRGDEGRTDRRQGSPWMAVGRYDDSSLSARAWRRASGPGRHCPFTGWWGCGSKQGVQAGSA